MICRLSAAILPLVALVVFSGNARSASVDFMGVFNAGNGLTLGNIPPAPIQPYAVTIEFTEGSGAITGGTFSVNGVSYNILPNNALTLASSVVTVSDTPANDSATVLAYFGGPDTGLISANLQSSLNPITNNDISAANLNALLLNSTASTLSARFDAGDGFYNATVAAVPEPSSGWLLLAGPLLLWGRRSRTARRLQIVNKSA